MGGRFFHSIRRSREVGLRREHGTGEVPDLLTEWYRSLTFDEAICWAFDTLPSRLCELYWSITWDDLRTQVRLKLGNEQAKSNQGVVSLIFVASKIFGGKPGPNGGAAARPVKNAREAQMAWSALMRASKGG
jgi:hypothetical protein